MSIKVPCKAAHTASGKLLLREDRAAPSPLKAQHCNVLCSDTLGEPALEHGFGGVQFARRFVVWISLEFGWLAGERVPRGKRFVGESKKVECFNQGAWRAKILTCTEMDRMRQFRLPQRCKLEGVRMHLLVGITANEQRCRELVEHSIGLVTALNPYIGYENATRIARVALETGRGVLELVREEKLLDEAMLNDILRPENMIAPRLVPLKA